MNSISEVITGKPVLPSRFISEDYDRFLFFDFFIRTAFAFFGVVQDAVLHRQGIDVYSADTLKSLAVISSSESWVERLKILDGNLLNVGDPFGFIIVSDEKRWIMAQDMPVNWGILAFRSNDAEMTSIFAALKQDWFLSLGDFVEAQRDSNSMLHEVFDRDFINQIIKNYGLRAQSCPS